jgi:outer membrane protein assembly factor BamB
VYCSHSGAITALDALTGKPAWAVRYPSRGDKTADSDPSPRDLAPCLFAAGRLYVAPADYDRLLCLDPATGETLWERGPLEVVHLLGVGEGRLIFTTPTGLRAVGADDGVDAWALPDGGGSLPPAGRGLLIGDLVLWPTASKGPGAFVVYAVGQHDGEQPGDPSLLSHIPAGNLVYADGCLVCADRQTLTIFTPPGMHLEEKEKQSRAEPESPAAALELARAEADAGLTGRALESYARAERLGAALSAPKRKRLGETVRMDTHATLLEAGRRAGAAKRWDDADGYFKQAASAEFAAPLRLQALLERAALWKTAGYADRAAVVLRNIRDVKELLALPVMDAAGVPRPAGEFVSAKSVDEPQPPVAPEQAPLPQPPYFRSWQATLDPGETPLAVADDMLLCGLYQPEAQARDRVKTSLALRVSDSYQPEAQARDGDSGKIRWRTPLSFRPAWADRNGGVIVAGGDGGAAGLRPADGQIVWQYDAPPPSPTFPSDAGTVLAPDALHADRLGNFHLLGGRLYCVQGSRRLFALNAENGRVLWARWVPGARLRQPYPCGRFFHVFPVNAEVLLVQTSGGRRWLLDAATGAVLHDASTASEPWPRSPVLLPDSGVCITPDAESVLLLDPVSGRDLWTHRLPGVTTRTGEPPRVTAGPNALLMAWAMNIGWRVQRLDRTTGKPLWSDPPLINTGELDVGSWSQDADAFYGVQDRTLFARSLKDGSLLWRQPLAGPSGRWRTQRFGDALLAYPIEAKGWRFQFRWLTAALQWTGCSPPEEKPGRGYPVVCCDAKTGRLVQRLDFAVDSQSFARLDRNGADVLPVFAMERVEGLPLVYVSKHGLIVALNGRAWGLSAGKQE